MSNHCIHGNEVNSAQLVNFTAVPWFSTSEVKHSQHKVFIGAAFNIQCKIMYTVTGIQGKSHTQTINKIIPRPDT